MTWPSPTPTGPVRTAPETLLRRRRLGVVRGRYCWSVPRSPSTKTSTAAVELAVPRSFDAGYGQDVDRGLCLGGGGLFFVAWHTSYLQTLAGHGVRFESSDRVVGTSAGSLVASALVGGRLKRFHSEVSVLAKLPALVSVLAPAAQFRPSQQRALDLFLTATDAEPDTIQEIGRAALAAVTPRPEVTRRNISLILGTGRLRSEALHITCVDAYTGERCVVTGGAGVATAQAAAASSAVPGVFAPQPIGDRRCMDGGVSGTGTHLDLLAGAKRVLILALTDGSDLTEGMMTSQPDDGRRELADLQRSGTEVLVRTPTEVDLLELMAPASVPRALAMGARQASADVGLLSTFWS
jgi:NTE family protein